MERSLSKRRWFRYGAVILGLIATFFIASCDIYQCLYGNAIITVCNATAFDILEIALYGTNDALVIRDTKVLPPNTERDIENLVRGKYRLTVLLDGYFEFTRTVDVTRLDCLVIEIVVP